MINLLAGNVQTPNWIKMMPISRSHNFIGMASEFNGSSYYRANPYYQQGYIPDSAFKNRKPPYQLGEIPQGDEFFEPTNKKHFQRVGYYSTIADQKIINSNDPNTNSPAKDKDYFRSLNINDIEGAATNTLISKAVKNKIKAQEELNRRAQEKKQIKAYEKARKFQRMEDDRKRMQALNILKNNSEPNYHQLVKRMRTEEKQKLAAKSQQPHPEHKRSELDASPNTKAVNKDPIQAYHQQLQQAEREIKELQLQLSQVKSHKEKAQQDYHDRFMQQQSPSRQDHTNHIVPITSSTPKYSNSQQYYPENPEQSNNYSPNSKFHLTPQELSYLALQRQKQEKAALNYHQEPIAAHNNQRSIQDSQAMERGDSNVGGRSLLQPLTAREHKQQHRRQNPTFLSYGSPSIGLAGKNIVGY